MTTITEPYAKALLELATSENALEEIVGEIQIILRMLNEAKGLDQLMCNPFIAKTKKKQAFKDIFTALEKQFQESIRSDILNFLYLLIDRNRIDVIKDVLVDFLKLCEENQEIRMVKVKTALNMSLLEQARLQAVLKTRFGFDTIKLKMQVDPSLLGGFVVRTGTTVIDTSLKYQIEKINRLFDV